MGISCTAADAENGAASEISVAASHEVCFVVMVFSRRCRGRECRAYSLAWNGGCGKATRRLDEARSVVGGHTTDPARNVRKRAQYTSFGRNFQPARAVPVSLFTAMIDLVSPNHFSS